MQTSLPPLPLTKGALFIDNSGWMEGCSTCYRYLEYKNLRLRIPAAEKPSLNFGSAMHLALEHRYKHYQNRPVDDGYYNDIATILTDFFEQHPAPSDDWRTMNWLMEVLKRYNTKYETEAFQVMANSNNDVLVEQTFTLPLFTWEGWLPISALPNDFPKTQILQAVGDSYLVKIPIIYIGRIDLPVHLDGDVYVMDHKTTSIMGSMFWDEMRMTAQQRGYVWSFNKLTGMPVKGYIVNGIRTKEPPLYVQNGKSTGKYSPGQWWDESFQRERFNCEQWKLDEWEQNTVETIEEFFFHYKRGYMQQKTKWCSVYGKCPFYDVCQLHPDDRGVFLASGQFTDNVWSPLKEATQSKQ